MGTLKSVGVGIRVGVSRHGGQRRKDTGHSRNVTPARALENADRPLSGVADSLARGRCGVRAGSLTNGQGSGEAVTRLLLPAGRIGGVIGRGGEVGFIFVFCRTLLLSVFMPFEEVFPRLFIVSFVLSDVLSRGLVPKPRVAYPLDLKSLMRAGLCELNGLMRRA